MDSKSSDWKRCFLPAIGCLVWFGVCVLFFGVSLVLGGDAMNGKIEGGHYFLGAHGHYREVSRGVYTFSALLGAFFGLGMPVFAFSMWWSEPEKDEAQPRRVIGKVVVLGFLSLAGGSVCYLAISRIVEAFS